MERGLLQRQYHKSFILPAPQVREACAAEVGGLGEHSETPQVRLLLAPSSDARSP